MFIQPAQFNSNQNLAIQPVRGLKCPISFDSMDNPVYLKGCEHAFEREIIKNVFNKCFKLEDVAPCPMCNRPYSIAKMLPNFETREQAINAFFETILIVPVVSNEINGLLEKRKNKIVALTQANHLLAEQNKLLLESNKVLAERNTVLTQDLEKTRAILDHVRERKNVIKKERNDALQDVDDISKEKDLAYRHLKISYSFATTAVATTAVYIFFINSKK